MFYIIITALPADPGHARAQSNWEYYQYLMNSEPDKYVDIEDVEGRTETVESDSPEARERMTSTERYESLCRGPWPLVSLHGLLMDALCVCTCVYCCRCNI